MPLDFLLDIHFVDRQPLVNPVGVAGLSVEEPGVYVERVRQAVGWIHAHHQRAISKPGELKSCCRGNTGLPYAPFAAKKKDAHNPILGQLTISLQRRT
jgi:hypothetical protein